MSRFGISGCARELPVQMTILASLVIAAAISMSPTGVFANDTIARFGAGGIDLIKTDHIRMLEEVLEISPHNVHVKYRFLNESDRDIETDVAFPFPGYHTFSLTYLPGAEGPKTLRDSFKVLVNGRPVKTKLVRKAVIRDRDITDELRKSGLSDKEIFFDVDDKDRPALIEKVNKLRGESAEWWRIEEIAFWKMTFPEGKEIVVEHEYAPATGGEYTVVSYGDSVEDLKHNISKLWNFFGSKDHKGEACRDEPTKRAIENRVKKALSKNGDWTSVSVRDVEYILGTGRNWKGPIGDFTLRVKKEKPDEFVSLCFPGKPKKISPTVYEFHEKEFVPPDKLVVYFYSVGPEVAQ